MTVKTVAMLTAGGLAPCLSSAVGGLIERYSQVAPDVRIIAYVDGYAGLLTGRFVEVTPEVREQAHLLHLRGGSPIGNSRVKLTNVADCVKRGLVQEGQDPLHVAAEQLTKGPRAARGRRPERLVRGHLTVVGLPKTIDNDVVPIRQTLGAWTAAEQGSIYAQNIIAEHTSNPRMLIIHEVMGRACGWLTAETARRYHQWEAEQDFVEGFVDPRAAWDVHAVFVPEDHIDLDAEATRLRAVMDELGCVNIFLSEGAGVADIVEQMKAAGQEVPIDPFGHVQLDKVNPGAWFAKQFAERVGAEKTMVQKSGYFARSAAANAEDLALIKQCTDLAVDAALRGESGVIGEDEERGNELRPIEFPRIKGHKKFDTSVDWFGQLKASIGQG